ncbi:hypothetical protein [Tissierella creatinophila]|uniref:Uncharacterized protein n=1 Tax=Tissierella creatinophila DSM 6911 TaxID=1123403 RepID=A0A1U7M570_TISCR|nr:hypothetical protein [Tissierella creatinophila]OLS02457.1 hypothetical protein TICRE_15750 [Tissierella creatinophila DSM 6911]
MIKKITIFSLCLCLLSLGSGKVFADGFVEEVLENNLEVNPYMNYISTSSCNLYKQSNDKVTIDCSIEGYKGITTKVSITANLQQYERGKWINIKTFTQSSNSHRTSLSETVSITKGYTYRVSAQVKAYSASDIETRNLISKNIKNQFLIF